MACHARIYPDTILCQSVITKYTLYTEGHLVIVEHVVVFSWSWIVATNTLSGKYAARWLDAPGYQMTRWFSTPRVPNYWGYQIIGDTKLLGVLSHRDTGRLFDRIWLAYLFSRLPAYRYCVCSAPIKNLGMSRSGTGQHCCPVLEPATWF